MTNHDWRKRIHEIDAKRTAHPPRPGALGLRELARASAWASAVPTRRGGRLTELTYAAGQSAVHRYSASASPAAIRRGKVSLGPN
jgi:hypothetical protein